MVTVLLVLLGKDTAGDSQAKVMCLKHAIWPDHVDEFWGAISSGKKKNKDKKKISTTC
jgi:hypothetical protein